VRWIAHRFIPEDKARIVTALPVVLLKRYVEYDFHPPTSGKARRVSPGHLKWKDLLRDFWTQFSAAIAETKD